MAVGDSTAHHTGGTKECEGEGEGALPLQPVPPHPWVWTGAEVLAKEREWKYALTAQEQEELIAAAKSAVATGKEIVELTREDFPLPTLGAKAEQWRNDALFGLGFKLIEGFPIDRLDRREIVTGYFGLGLYWGHLLSQNAKGHVLGHIKDLGLKAGADDVRIYQTNAAQPWHKDGADLVSLLCLKTAKSGGISGLASQAAVYNRLLEHRPDLVQALTTPLPFDRKGEVLPGEPQFWLVPYFSWYKGYLNAFPNYRHILEAQRFPDVPRLTELQKEALAVFETTAEELKAEFQFQPGQIQLVSNHALLHTRTAYQDHEGVENRRHLLRLWVNHPDARPINPSLFTGNTSISKGIFHGIVKPVAPLEAE